MKLKEYITESQRTVYDYYGFQELVFSRIRDVGENESREILRELIHSYVGENAMAIRMLDDIETFSIYDITRKLWLLIKNEVKGFNKALSKLGIEITEGRVYDLSNGNTIELHPITFMWEKK